MPANDGNIVLEDAQILFRNFAGREDQFNAEGNRNFCVLLDDELAEKLAQDGWNVKYLKAREEGDQPRPYLQVSVKYRGRNGAQVRPPLIFLITSQGRTELSEDETELLDYVDIEKVDLIIRPYTWAVSGKSGTKAYLKSFFLTAAEDELQQKYADVPIIERGGQPLAIEGGSDPDVWDAEVVSETEEEQLALGR